MLLNLYAMYDRLDGSHRSPVTGRSDVRTAKEFCDMMQNYKAQSAQKGQNVDLLDYELHKLGTFDDETGAIVPLSHYEVVPLSYVSNDTSVSAPSAS